MADTASKHVNLALQGGGAHGAFTWGVLDRLLDDERLVIDAISGTSAGAMNAAMLVQGWAEGGRDGARRSLDAFWAEVSAWAPLSPYRRGPLQIASGSWNIDSSPTVLFASIAGRLLAPWQSNPLGLDPLREILKRRFRRDAACDADHIKLFVAATDVQSGRVRLFDNFNRRDVSTDALLASACLPQQSAAVVIDGRPYWDGGFMGNPAIWPFIYQCDSRDVMIVQVNPLERPGIPGSVAEIDDRLNEITFNAMLVAEMRAIAFAQKLLADEGAQGPSIDRLKQMLIHIVADEPTMRRLGATSKLNVEPEFLLYLKSVGRAAADRWLTANFALLNERSSVDIRTMFL